MAVKDLFSNKSKSIPRSGMNADYAHDKIFQEGIMSDKKVAKEINTSGRQRRVHKLFLEKSRDGKVGYKDMTEIALKLQRGEVEGISATRGRLIAKAFFPKGLKSKDKSSTTKKESVPDPKNIKSDSQNYSGAVRDKLSPAHTAHRSIPSSLSPTPTDPAEATEKKSSFFSALSATMRNKR